MSEARYPASSESQMPDEPDASGPSGPTGPSGPADQPEPVKALFGAVREIVLVLVIALGLSLLIKTFLVQAFFIPSPSMENTLIVGDRVLVSKLTPGPFSIRRGDVVVFSDTGDWLPSDPQASQGAVRDGIRSALTFVGLLPANSDEHLIKRVIGLPGDRVACCDAAGRLTVNRTAVSEPYLYPGDEPSDAKFSVTVPAGRLWVMGDHRSLSADSRAHREKPGDGAVPISSVVGRAFVLVWPLDRAKILHNPGATFATVTAG